MLQLDTKSIHKISNGKSKDGDIERDKYISNIEEMQSPNADTNLTSALQKIIDMNNESNIIKNNSQGMLSRFII